MSCEFRIFRHFVTIFRNLVIFRMSYLLNQMRFSKTFFTFKFFSEYSFKLANLLWHKLRLIFCCQSYDVIFAPKIVKIKNPKTYDCWENKVLLSCKVSAQTVKNWKTSLKEITFWWQLTRRESSLKATHAIKGNSKEVLQSGERLPEHKQGWRTGASAMLSDESRNGTKTRKYICPLGAWTQSTEKRSDQWSWCWQSI